jgi:hypothetical protein
MVGEPFSHRHIINSKKANHMAHGKKLHPLEPTYNPKLWSSPDKPVTKCNDVKHGEIMSLKDLNMHA